jgi:hypothetical protein
MCPPIAKIPGTVLLVLLGMVLCSCESSDTVKPKKRPPLPGEEVNELSWGRPTGPNDVASPYGLPMSR